MIFHVFDDLESRNFIQSKPNNSEVEFTSENGKTYHGVLYTANDEKSPLIIYFGGNAEISHQNMRVREEHGHWENFINNNALRIFCA